MRYTEERYISLLTDFGFKRIFGTNPNKDLLIDFLNSLFDGEQVVKNVTFLNSEHVGDVRTDRKAIFDVYCENEKGEKFIVEHFMCLLVKQADVVIDCILCKSRICHVVVE